MRKRKENELNLGKESIIHCLLAMAVKYSLESIVESLISRYQVHFDKSHQLGEEKAHMEMFMSMNGPVLVRADPLLKRAMAIWTNSSRTRTLEGMVHGTCIILMRHASIHRMNQKQLGDFKRRRTNLALLMKNNEETSKEEEQTWLC